MLLCFLKISRYELIIDCLVIGNSALRTTICAPVMYNFNYNLHIIKINCKIGNVLS